jgi:hypothetical protein
VALLLLDEMFMFQRGAHFATGVDDQKRFEPGVSTPDGACDRGGGSHVASPALRMNTGTKLPSMYANSSSSSMAPQAGDGAGSNWIPESARRAMHRLCDSRLFVVVLVDEFSTDAEGHFVGEPLAARIISGLPFASRAPCPCAR